MLCAASGGAGIQAFCGTRNLIFLSVENMKTSDKKQRKKERKKQTNNPPPKKKKTNKKTNNNKTKTQCTAMCAVTAVQEARQQTATDLILHGVTIMY